MSHGKNGQHKHGSTMPGSWEYDAWVSTYTAIKAGEQAGVSTDVEKVLGHPASSLLDILRDRKLIEEKYD